MILAGVLAAAITAAANTGVVKKVLSGDIVQIGHTFIARVSGLRAPRPGELLGREVYEFTLKELEGKLVQLATWTTDNTAAGIVYDEQGFPFVLIRYGSFSRDKGFEACFNEVLLNKGYARVDPKYLPDDLKHYLDLEKEAREKGLGIWKPTKPELVAAGGARPNETARGLMNMGLRKILATMTLPLLTTVSLLGEEARGGTGPFAGVRDRIILVIIVFVSVALFADHRRNLTKEAIDAGDLDATPPRGSDLVVRPSTRQTRVDSRPGSARRPRTRPVRRSGRTTPRR